MKKSLGTYLGFVVAAFLLAISVVVLRDQIKDYRLADIQQSFSNISIGQIVASFGFTLLGYAAMTGYDAQALRYLQQPLSYRRTATANFISTALSNTIGFAVLTGGAVRYRLYSAWGISAITTAEVIAFSSFTFWLGLFTLGSVGFLLSPLAIPLDLQLSFATARPLGALFLLLMVTYLLCSATIRRSLKLGKYTFQFPDLSVTLAQTALSSLDWGLAAAVLYMLLPSQDISYFSFLNIYLLAMTAGVLSNVPGGAGVFDTVIVLLLVEKVPGEAVLASLLAYRVIYYLIPFGLAAGLLLYREGTQKMRAQKLRRLAEERVLQEGD
ncbi:MAG: lysylphosphatidylglycerol synthase domain-containing protein [Phormidesmis sp.]